MGLSTAKKKTGPRGGAAKGQVGPCGESHQKGEFAGIRTVIPLLPADYGKILDGLTINNNKERQSAQP